MVKPPRQDQTQETVPASFPETLPRFATSGHDFTLQAVMEMHHSIGDLVAKTERLISDVKSQGEKIDAVRIKIAWVTGGAAAVGFILAVILAVLKLLPIAQGAFGH